METPPNLQVYDLGHLGLVASVLGQNPVGGDRGPPRRLCPDKPGRILLLRTFSYLLRLEARTSPQGPMAIAVPSRCVTP
jgi:hypothetical protein